MNRQRLNETLLFQSTHPVRGATRVLAPDEPAV